MLRWLMMLLAALALSACGGGSPSSTPAATAAATPAPTPTPTATPTATATNSVTVILDGGPAALDTGANGYTAFNSPYVTITLCAPGAKTNCQTIDHVLLDTGSVGLRVLHGVLNATLLAALPQEADSSGNPVGECYQYVSSYAFGSVREADFTIGGEAVAAMPFQVIADTGTFAAVPASCSSGGGTATATVQDLGANAIIGIGTTTTDCGTICQTAGNGSAAAYYDCPATGCQAIIARTASVMAPLEQLPNPVAAFASDNNGTIVTLPAVAQAGLATLTGTLTFGIGTQSDNALSASTILELTASDSARGPGLLTVTYKGATLDQSYIDTGSSVYYFVDSTIAICTQAGLTHFYCPASPVLLSPILTGTNNVSANAAFTLYNPNSLAATVHIAPGIGVDTALTSAATSGNRSFGLGLPFYFGHTVYTAIEGLNAGGQQGPYVAF